MKALAALLPPTDCAKTSPKAIEVKNCEPELEKSSEKSLVHPKNGIALEPKVSTPDSKKKRKLGKPPHENHSTPEKESPSTSLKQGYGGHTQKAETCWICGAARISSQKGTSCEYCQGVARKQLGHQRFNELKNQPELLEEVRRLSKEVQDAAEPKRKHPASEAHLRQLLDRFEEALPKVESMVETLSCMIDAFPACKKCKKEFSKA